MADKSPPPPICPKCAPCKPGLPGWLGTMADMMTNTLTFFVLLLSFAKTETSKQEAALGSIRNAFGGLAYKMGETVTLGKTAYNDPAMLEAEDPARPFPIDFLTSEGLLDKYEMNRESTEILRMRKDRHGGIVEQVDVYETQRHQVHLRGIVFKPEALTSKIAVETFEKLLSYWVSGLGGLCLGRTSR